MRALLRLGWRNLWRNRRRTLINLSAAGFGLCLVIFYQGLIGGMMGDARNELDNTGMGHVEVTAPLWRAKRGAALAIEGPETVLKRLTLPPGAQAGARVVARGLASSAWGSQGVEVHGVDPAVERDLANYVEDIRAGEKLAEGDVRGALIGETLAERLKLKPGQKIRLMVQRADGEMGADVFRVRGVFHSVSTSVSRSRVLVATAAARTLLGVGDVAHQIVVQLERSEDADQVAARMRAVLGPGFEVQSLGELLPAFKAMEDYVAKMMVVMAAFVYLLVGLGIMNTMLMSVLERTREFGVMRALGNRAAQIVELVLAEAFWIATLSVALGLSLGLFLTWAGSHGSWFDFSKTLGESFEMGGATVRSVFHTAFVPVAGVKSAAAVYLLTLLVGLYPAYRINKLLPAEALRAT
jgi:ABC-type lipoprotein release transport system permease subunit